MNQPLLYPIAILAGGLATRLLPLTADMPKAMVMVRGEPFIAHQLRLLRKKGLQKIVLLLGYLGEQIESYVGDGSAFDLTVNYSYDGDKLLGTAGAIKNALAYLGENFFVTYGDTLLTCDYYSVQQDFQRAKKAGLMTVFKNNGLWDKCNVIFNEGEIKVYDKKRITPEMHYIDYGLSVFNQQAFHDVTVNEYLDLAVLLQNLLNQNQLAAHEVFNRFYEIGSFAGLAEAEQVL